MFFPGAAVYMDKIACGSEIADVDRHRRVRRPRTCAAPPRRRGSSRGEITVVVLDRDRNHELIDGLREVGAKVNLITDGDVAPALAAARPDTPVDLMMGIGGTPEGVISAAAVKCLGGAMQGKLWPRTDDERQRARRRGLRPRPRADAPTISSPATTSSWPRPASPTAPCCAACATRQAGPSRTRSSCAPAPAPSGGSRRSTRSRSSPARRRPLRTS